MKILSRFLAMLIASVLLVPGSTFAATTPPPMPQQAVSLATVNIYNAKIMAQHDNSFELSFDITNRVGVQPNVKYSVFLIQETQKSQQAIFGEKVYDETLTLGPNSSVHKSITYVAPSQLSGVYELWIQSKNTDGFPFSAVFAGKVELSPSTAQAVTIAPTTCYLTVVGDATKTRYSLNQGVDIADTETLQATCMIENTTTTSLTLMPSFATHVRSAYGDLVPGLDVKQTPVAIKAGEKKEVTLAVPTAKKAQAYDLELSFIDEVNKLSTNPVNFHYVVRGASATIQNLHWDKESYQPGDTAVLSYMWTPAADNFAGSRGRAGTTLTSPTLTLTMTDEHGVSCGTPVTDNLSTDPKTFARQVAYKVTAACAHPQIDVSIKDTTHGVLAQSLFQTIKTAAPLNAAGAVSPSIMLLMLVLVLVVVGVVMFMMWKSLRKGSVPPSTPGVVIAFLLVSGGLFGGAPSAHADTWYAPDALAQRSGETTIYTTSFSKPDTVPGGAPTIFHLKSKSTGLCVAMPGGAPAPGVGLVLGSCGTALDFTSDTPITGQGALGAGMKEFVVNGTNLCYSMSDPYADWSTGQLQTCSQSGSDLFADSRGADGSFTLTPKGGVVDLSGGAGGDYYFQCTIANGAGAGAPIQQSPCDGGAAQRFTKMASAGSPTALVPQFLPSETMDINFSLYAGYCMNTSYDHQVVYSVDGVGNPPVTTVIQNRLTGNVDYGSGGYQSGTVYANSSRNAPTATGIHTLDLTATMANPLDSAGNPIDFYYFDNQGKHSGTAYYTMPFSVSPPPTPAPTVTITSTGGNVPYGSTNTVNWTSGNGPNNCDVTKNGGVFVYSGTNNSNGSIGTGVLNNTTTFTVTCTNLGGSVSATVTFTVIPPPPALSVTPTNIDFGNVDVSASKCSNSVNASYVTIKNVGGGTLNVTSITPSSHFACTSGCTGSLAANASQVANICLTAPATPQTLGESVKVNSNAGNQDVTVSANITPIITINPGPLDFGQVIVKKCKSLPLSVINNSVSVTVPAGTISVVPPFSCTSSCAYPAIPPGTQTQIMISYCPTAVTPPGSPNTGIGTLSTSIQNNTGNMLGQGMPLTFKVIEN